jgi:hypothetical protein
MVPPLIEEKVEDQYDMSTNSPKESVGPLNEENEDDPSPAAAADPMVVAANGNVNTRETPPSSTDNDNKGTRQPEYRKERHHRRRKVHFGSRIKVQQIPHITNIPLDIRKAVWYTQLDFVSIKRSYTQTVKLMMKGLADVTSDLYHCTRGLEARTREGARLKHEVKLTTLIAVLKEQEQLAKHNITGTEAREALAEVYQQAGSTKCQNLALVQGLKDEQDIQHYIFPQGNELEYSSEFSVNGSPMENIMEDIPLGSSDANCPEKEPSSTKSIHRQILMCGVAA